MTILHRLRRYTLLICIATWAAAFITTHIPAERVPKTGLQDTSLHLLGFLGLGGVFWLALAAYGVRVRRRIALVIVIMAAYAAMDEITQGLVGRDPDANDWLMDSLGALCAVAILETLSLLAGKWRSAPPTA